MIGLIINNATVKKESFEKHHGECNLEKDLDGYTISLGGWDIWMPKEIYEKNVVLRRK